MCCTNSSGMAGPGEQGASYWGEYVCDLPEWTARNMFEHIREQHDVSCHVLSRFRKRFSLLPVLLYAYR